MGKIYSPFLADFAGAIVTLLAGVVADDTLRVSHSLDRPVLRVLEDVSENLVGISIWQRESIACEKGDIY